MVRSVNSPGAENRKCPACLQITAAPAMDVRDEEYAVPVTTTYRRCFECHTFFQDPMPNEETLSSYYPQNYHSFRSGGWLTHVKYSRRLAQLKNYVRTEDFTFLDYGCGDGAFLAFGAE